MILSSILFSSTTFTILKLSVILLFKVYFGCKIVDISLSIITEIEMA